MIHKLYIATTSDRFELPIYVADSPEGLARKMGTTKGTVLSEISHAKKYTKHRSYHRVDYTEQEWNE